MRVLDPLATEAALATERQFVLSLGGSALEIAGATLVTHEKLPAPRFNFVQVTGVGAERQTAFFERALDHYFQRALRPTFRIPDPVPAHLDSALRRFGFRPAADPLVLLSAEELPTGSAPPPEGVRTARNSEVDLVVSFWTYEAERPELRAALEVVWNHPNPDETLVPVLGYRAARPVSAALVYRYRSTAGIYAVATQPLSRGQGSATDVVRYARATSVGGRGVRYSIFADSPRLERHLKTLGFTAARRFRIYELPRGAELALPPAAPSGPPRWRPPRAPR